MQEKNRKSEDLTLTEPFSPEVRSLLYGNQQDAVLVVDQEGSLQMYNRVAARLFGNRRDMEELLQPAGSARRVWRLEDVNGIVIPESRWPTVQARRGALMRDSVYRFRRTDFVNAFAGSITTTPFRDPVSGHRLSVLNVRDVTRQQMVEEEAERYLQDLSFLVAVSREMMAPGEPEELLRKSVQAVCRLPAQRVYTRLLFNPLLRLDDEDLRNQPAWWGVRGSPAPLRGLLAARLENAEGKADGWIVASAKKGWGQFDRGDESIFGQLASIVSLALQQSETQRSLAAQRDHLQELAGELKKLNQALEEQVRDRTRVAEERSRQLLALAVQLAEAEERERGRIAGLLHEDLQQTLASARFLLQSLQLDLQKSGGPPWPMIGRINQLLQDSLSQARHLEANGWRQAGGRAVRAGRAGAGVPHPAGAAVQRGQALGVPAGRRSPRPHRRGGGGGGQRRGAGIRPRQPARGRWVGGGVRPDGHPGARPGAGRLLPAGQRARFGHPHPLHPARPGAPGGGPLSRPAPGSGGGSLPGRQAVEMARALSPDVIVMDVSMPEMDGIEATRRIKAEMPGVRIIGLSMFEEGEIAGRMREAGAEAFVSKEASSGALMRAIYGLAAGPPG